MWRQRLASALRTVTILILGAVYLTGKFVLEAGIGVIATIGGASLLAAALVCITLGRARLMYVALLFNCLGIGWYPLILLGVSNDALAVMIVAVIGLITIAYGAAELRAESGEPFRDPVGLLLADDDELGADDPVHVPTATVMRLRSYTPT